MAPRFSVEPSLEGAREAVSKPKQEAQKKYTWADELPIDIGSLKAAIPAHCFEHDTLRSLGWLAHDVVFHLAFLWFGARVMLGNPYLDNVIGWTVFAVLCGTQLTGIWVLGHEAGHGAFVANRTVNDIVGYVCHHYLMVPYFNWQYTHGVHHRRTNHLTEGETHVPNERRDIVSNKSRFELLARLPRPLQQIIGVASLLLIGWPAYMLFHLTGARSRREAGAHHFALNPLFHPSVHDRVRMSNFGIAAGLVVLAYLCYSFGFFTVVKLYGGPWTVTHAWLVLLTFLHHSHPSLPHFRKESESAWTWLKGALCTVDCDYGAVLDYLHHDIGNTHLVHHVFSGLPWYHQREATRHLLGYLNERGVGHLYTYNPHPFKTLFEYNLALCYVDDEGDVVFFKSVDDACRHLKIN